MPKKLAGVTVLKDGSAKWATIAGLFLGVPTYAVTHGIGRTIELVYAALEWLLLGPYSFAGGLLEDVFGDAVLGIQLANSSFIAEIQDAGVLAPIVAGAGTVLTAYVIYRGVTGIYG